MLPGSKQSLHTGQQLVSCGNPALDHILGKFGYFRQKMKSVTVLLCWSISGGGLPIGSILLIEEDKFARYSKYLSRMFLAEGGVHKHVLFLANLNNDPNEMVCSFAFAFHLNSNPKNPLSICSIIFRFKNCLQHYRIQKIRKIYHICHTIKTMTTTTTMA